MRYLDKQTLKTKKVVNSYIEYWDDVISRWANEGGVVPSSEECWFLPKSKLRIELMPEPYWGNPDCCSAVLLNYNPGGPDGEPLPDDNCHINNVLNADSMKMSGAMHACYSRIALEFPWLDEVARQDFTSNHIGTKDWMRQRNGWISRLAKSDKRPFFLDLCGWHSKNWRLGKYTPEIKAYISEHIIPVLDHAIRKSDLGIGLCVGKQLGDAVLGKLGFSEVTSELGFEINDPARGWQPIPEVNRWYRVYRSSEGLYIINTWALGSNRQPGAQFKGKELEIIDKIKDIK